MTTLAVGNVGKQRDSVTVGHDVGGCCGAAGKPRSDDAPPATPARAAWLRDYQTREQAEDFWQAIRRHGTASPAR